MDRIIMDILKKTFLNSYSYSCVSLFMPPFWSRSNPIDILGDASPERFRQTLEVCFDGKDTDGVCVILAPQALTEPVLVAEKLVSVMKDRRYPVFACWMGGIFTEVLKDRALGLPPMNRLLARRMMQETKAWTLLQGYRNRPSADMESLEKMIIRLSQLLIDFPQIAELDMNPVLIKDGKPVAVDARILVSKTDRPSPLHLVISPYPEEDETHLVTDGN